MFQQSNVYQQSNPYAQQNMYQYNTDTYLRYN
ncbi:spore coat protein, partial [Bacillus mobilis]